MGEVRISLNLPLNNEADTYFNQALDGMISRYEISGGDYSRGKCTFELINSETRILDL